MHAFTVYAHKRSDAFRVVTGEHVATPDPERGYTVRVYTGSDAATAAQAAFAGESRADIRAQITRFLPVPAAPKVRAFNTGRLYTQHGQRIAYTVLGEGRVAMLDLDRQIEYVLLMPAPRRDSDVLRAYDNHDGSMRGVWDADFQAIKAQLYAAARAVVSA